jgi:hypothetical protein
MAFDVLGLAREGTWISGRLADRDSIVAGTETRLSVNGADTDPEEGFVRTEVLTLEDGSEAFALFTHPKWVSDGTIKGFLPPLKMPTNGFFRAQVGFVEGASGDGVRFQVWEHHDYSGSEVHSRVADYPKRPDGRLVTIVADLSHLANEMVVLELRVDTGDGIGRIAGAPADSGRDWAVWVTPIVDSDAAFSARTWVFMPSKLYVDESDESSGDDPYIGMIYFRSVFAQGGSTNVGIFDQLPQLGQDVDSGVSLPIHGIVAADSFSQFAPTGFDPQHPGRLRVKGLPLSGVVIVAIEEDADNRDVVRKRMSEAACSLRRYLREQVEQAPDGVRLDQATEILATLGRGQLPDCDLTTSYLGGGGGFIWQFFSHLGTVIESRDDLVGTPTAAFVAVDPQQFKQLKAAITSLVSVPIGAIGLSPGEKFQPVDTPITADGSGSKWTIHVIVNEAVLTYPRSPGF